MLSENLKQLEKIFGDDGGSITITPDYRWNWRCVICIYGSSDGLRKDKNFEGGASTIQVALEKTVDKFLKGN